MRKVGKPVYIPTNRESSFKTQGVYLAFDLSECDLASLFEENQQPVVNS